MGLYLNSRKPYDNYREISKFMYFIDKTALLGELPLLAGMSKEGNSSDLQEYSKGNKYICITRPRRFGKTVMAGMIASYFGKGYDSRKLFEKLNIASHKYFESHLNRHNVIYISLNEIPRSCETYRQYIERIQNRLLEDLIREFPTAHIHREDAVWDALNQIYELEGRVRFIFVLDEWDYIFHRNFVTKKDRLNYIDFLSNLLKDQPYVELAYMTGILPIAKYSSGSELNMFIEYTMASKEKYSGYFGFNDEEVDELYARYLKTVKVPHITREELRIWYDGYHTMSGRRIYNPRSVVCALNDDQAGSYWTSSGPYDEIFYYIEKNTADVREDLAFMISGIPVPAKIQEYAATSMNLNTKDEIFSAMVVYGFLSSENGFVSIPNRELMEKFRDMLQKESSLGYIHRLARQSDKMLKATLAADTKTMCGLLEFVHNSKTPLLHYNNEAELTAVVNLLYLSARDHYRIEREDKAGKGYVDFIFYPETDLSADGIILELKVDHSPEEAIRQIKEKQYALRFAPRLGEERKFTGRILAVGIAYDRGTKRHACEVEVLRGAAGRE